MLGFLQGFAYGLAVSCAPWFFIGMLSPRLAVATLPPRRWEVVARYWFVFPFIAFVVWLTSLWGGFSPTFAGWLAGLMAIAIELPLERRWRSWRAARQARQRDAARDAAAAQQRARLEREARERGVLVLDPDQPPVGADDIVLALCEAKRPLLAARRPDLASQADRLYTRYAHVGDVLRSKFDARELTFERSQGLVAEVCRGALDTFAAMASLAQGVSGIDADYVQRRLEREGSRLGAEESQALRRRLELVEDTERRLRELAARNEAALTALDDTAVAVARVATGRPQAKVDADQALEDLRRFAGKAGLYGRGAA